MTIEAIRCQDNIKNLNVGGSGSIYETAVSGTVPDDVQAIQITGGASPVEVVLGNASKNYKGQSITISVTAGAEAVSIAPNDNNTLNGDSASVSFGTDGFIGTLVATSSTNWQLVGQTIPASP